MGDLSHIGAQGRARMVDVSDKDSTAREAVARARVRMQPETLARIRDGGIAKGDVLGVAQVAGIQAAKKTSELIPMCHPLQITGVDLGFEYGADGETLEIEAAVRCTDRTGVEMEALTAAAVAALTVYDMCKAIDRGMTVESVRLAKKTGGKSGTYERKE